MRGKAFDITKTVFENKVDVMIYVMGDVEAADTEFIFSIPNYTFSVSIGEKNYKKEIEEFFRYENMFRNVCGHEKIIGKIIEVIENWDEL